MRPTKSSPTSNRLGNLMNPSEHISTFKQEDHSNSFDQLTGLMQTSRAPQSREWKPLYKVAATFLIVCLTFVACSIPVQQEEEIGYMIKGVSTTSVSDFKTKLKGTNSLDLGQVSINQILHEEIGKEPQTISEVIMILPEANLALAQEKKQALQNVASFTSLEILPIEETVERPLYEAALKSIDLHVDKSLTNEQVASRINTFLQENAKGDIKADLDVNEKGERVVKLYMQLTKDLESRIEVKRSLEGLARDVVPKDRSLRYENMSKEELLRLKQQEIQKLQEFKEKQDNN